MVNTPLQALAIPPPRWGLIPRLGLIAAILVLETLIVSYFVQGTPIDSVFGAARVVRDIEHWLFRFMIAYAVSLAMLAYLRGPSLLSAISELGLGVPLRNHWGITHLVLFAAFAGASVEVFDASPLFPYAMSALGWHVLALASAMSLFAAVAPLPVWLKALRQTGTLPLYALIPAAFAVAAIQASQLLWAPTAQVTFRLVGWMLAPICPTLQSDFATLTLSTDRFAVTVSEICSGLEGVGLMLIFCTTWLWYFRREYYFPRALVIVPLAVLLIFLLNAMRIAAIVLIGDAGYIRIATIGFHSQAGWIAFNLAALGVAVLARRSPWLHRHSESPPAAAADNAVAPYLMPLLTILAAGMIAHALSGGFDFLYPLRLIAAIAALWYYRRRYASLDWRFSGRGVGVGVLLFGIWVAFGHVITSPSARPDALASLPPLARAAWIGCRMLAAIVTVPIAEELAYRGFLLRRLASADFESLPFGEVRWPALLACAIAFGITHGGMWLPGVLAGLAYGALAIKTGRIGEAVAAHAATNALLAAYVLLFDQWQLW